MGEQENLRRDNELVAKVREDIELTMAAITTARDEQNWEAMEQLTKSLEHQCTAYRHLREIDV